MLSHLHRFHGHGSLRYLYRNGKSSSTKQFSVKYNHNPKRVHSRFAVVVSKKIFKSAVKRNRVRRRLFETVRLQLDEIKPSYDIVITVFSPELIVTPHNQLAQEVRELLVKASLIR
jgi:ribonuclease P protein component